MIDLCSSTSLVATWDDHEVFNDWSWDDDGMPDDGYAALAAFVLDCRGERFGEDYISPEQMAWLKDELLASTARFKIVANSVPITDMDAVYFGIAADDRWDGFPVQRAEILDWIADNAIPGVLWIAGDFHWGAVTNIGRPGQPHEDLHEVFCGPGGSIVNPLCRIAPPDQYPVVVDRWNSVLFEADPVAGTIRVVFQGDNGILADHLLEL
jgi:alkaline phosphatase D